MMRRNYCLAWAFFLFASITSAQEFRATLTGRVTDPQDLAVVGATVQARNISTNEVSSGKTDSQDRKSELQSQSNLVCRLLLEKKNKNKLSSYSTPMYTFNTRRSTLHNLRFEHQS